MAHLDNLLKNCDFQTSRLRVWSLAAASEAGEESEVAGTALDLLSPEVVKALPGEFQGISTLAAASAWLETMQRQCQLLLIQARESREILGFIFLYPDEAGPAGLNLHLGYLLGKAYWGRGYGKEFLQGLLHWCRTTAGVSKLTAGVEQDNQPSIKLLQRLDFKLAHQEPELKTRFYEYKFSRGA
ncbi:GNAT family N-acetyltransferase [Dongshaea marina]|uniref:GNAT family N-acetyltransferase n=1 Tax=Dongshaea marina TaxID=2047966 RepID=UPI000D3E8115|nr:GNAT family N-acetyltransferase [Dongshaea marina]